MVISLPKRIGLLSAVLILLLTIVGLYSSYQLYKQQDFTAQLTLGIVVTIGLLLSLIASILIVRDAKNNLIRMDR